MKGGAPLDDKCILGPQRDCIGKAEAAKLEGRIKALEEWKEDSKKFHNDFYDWQREQIARDVRLDEKLGSMEASLSKLASWQETEREKPGKRWGRQLQRPLQQLGRRQLLRRPPRFGVALRHPNLERRPHEHICQN